MKVIFAIPYRTEPGTQMTVVGALPQTGMGDPRLGLALSYDPDQSYWTGNLSLGAGQGPFRYGYCMADDDGDLLCEPQASFRTFDPEDFAGCDTVELHDFWRPPDDVDGIFETTPFKEVLFKRQAPSAQYEEHGGASLENRREDGRWVRMRVAAPCVPPGQCLFVSGAIPELGGWDMEKALPLHPATYPFWETDLWIDATQPDFRYKYACGNALEDPFTWEEGEDRTFRCACQDGIPPSAIVVSDWPFQNPGGPWKGAGVAVPVFSLRTDTGLGVGEFPDLMRLVDWAKGAGLRMIQLLPVNDTTAYGTWYDSYPYSIISVFALHPIYLRLSPLAKGRGDIAARIAKTAAELNGNPVMDYEKVLSVKMEILGELFREDALEFLSTESFQAFFREQATWLRPYAVFRSLRNRYGTNDYRTWGENRRGTPETVDRLSAPGSPLYQDILFHYFIQYHLHEQLLEAARYARKQGVVLKGDIPIGVGKYSVETWQHPEWFQMDQSTGAPPDDFAAGGQNWGFPTYNWEAMAADGYGWWQRRLNHMSRYFDAVRLDHVLGFFRIWSIPDGATTALLGRFQPAIPLDADELANIHIELPEELCEPCIAREALELLFGEDFEAVMETFFCEAKPGAFRFKAPRPVPAELTARVEKLFSPDRRERNLQGLRSLLEDVVLIADTPERNRFHPRILMDRTLSFQRLDLEAQEALHKLYEDYFFSRQESLWEANGRERLGALSSSTSMLICGEDLGMVPRCLPRVLERLHILALRIQRMPETFGEVFGHPDAYPYLAVASPGSHDMSTIRGWWEEEDRAVVQFYYQNILGHQGIAPKTCTPAICGDIVRLHLESGSMWVVVAIQDLLGMNAHLRNPDPHAERINDASTPHHNWNFRMHRTLDELIAQKAFSDEVREIVRTAKR